MSSAFSTISRTLDRADADETFAGPDRDDHALRCLRVTRDDECSWHDCEIGVRVPNWNTAPPEFVGKVQNESSNDTAAT